MKASAFERITKMLERAHTDERVFSPTELYKEGWMLRVVLSALEEGIDCPPLTFKDGARWYSEAKIRSPFQTREGEWKRKRKDRMDESHTELDGVLGHITIQSKAGFSLADDSTQFVVIEAKMGSELKDSVTYDREYDQAVRNVACMGWTIHKANKPVTDFDSLGFYVTAPDEHLKSKASFSSYVSKPSIDRKVKNRISRYVNEDVYDELQTWYNDFFIEFLDRIDIGCISWEDIVNKIDDDSIRDFYQRCRLFE